MSDEWAERTARIAREKFPNGFGGGFEVVLREDHEVVRNALQALANEMRDVCMAQGWGEYPQALIDAENLLHGRSDDRPV